MVGTKLYGQDRTIAWNQHADKLSGNNAALICVVHTEPLAALTSDALRKSFAALGFGEDACCFLRLDENEGTGIGLKQLFALVEALDPLMLVLCDKQAVADCQDAYRQQIPVHTQTRVFGRPTRAFNDLNAWIADEQGKQKAWALLKTLR